MAEMSLALILSATNLISPVLNQVAQSLGPLGSGFAAATTAAVGFGEQAVQVAGGFQSSMLRNVALAGLSQSSYQSMADKILALAPQIGEGPQQLSDGLYNVLSAGVPAANALDVLKLSAEAAATGMTDTHTITDGLTSAMNAMSIPFSKTANVMADLTATVSGGKMTWQNLASSVGMLAVTAHEAGISLQDATAGLATMTDSGMSANRAGMDLDFLMRDLGMNVDKVALNAKKMHLSFDEATFKTMSLMDKLTYLQKITGGNASEMMKLTGGATGMAAAQAILTNHGQLYAGILNNVSKAYQQGTMTQESFKTTQQGLNQQLAQLNAAWQVMLVTVGTALLPTITNLVKNVTPLVVQFAQWLVTSGTLTTLVSGLISGVTHLASAFMAVVSVVSSVITFFQQNQVASAILIGVLAGLASVLLMIAVTVLPILIAGWIAETIAAVSAGIATVTAFAPVILIALAVAAAVAAIILIVRNWGAISTWLQGVWAAFVSWFMGAMAATGNFFAGVWKGVVSGIQSAWNGMGSFFQGVGKGIVTGWQATTNGVVGAFQWMYNHNYYWKDMVDAITNWTKATGSWLQGAWQATSSWLGDRWHELSQTASTVWGGITTATSAEATKEGDVIHSAWTATSDFTVRTWNAISTAVASAWRTISSIIGSAWSTYIAGPLGALWNSISAWFGNVVNQAVQWGANLISGFVRGILSGVGAVGNAISQVAHTVVKFLGFHSPPEAGPASDADTWAPNMVKMFTAGVQQNLPALQASFNLLTSPVGANAPARAPSGGGSSVFAPQIVINVPQGRLDQASAKQIAQEVNQYLSQQFLRSGVVLPTFKGV